MFRAGSQLGADSLDSPSGFIYSLGWLQLSSFSDAKPIKVAKMKITQVIPIAQLSRDRSLQSLPSPLRMSSVEQPNNLAQPVMIFTPFWNSTPRNWLLSPYLPRIRRQVFSLMPSWIAICVSLNPLRSWSSLRRNWIGWRTWGISVTLGRYSSHPNR